MYKAGGKESGSGGSGGVGGGGESSTGSSTSDVNPERESRRSRKDERRASADCMRNPVSRVIDLLRRSKSPNTLEDRRRAVSLSIFYFYGIIFISEFTVLNFLHYHLLLW